MVYMQYICMPEKANKGLISVFVCMCVDHNSPTKKHMLPNRATQCWQAFLFIVVTWVVKFSSKQNLGIRENSLPCVSLWLNLTPNIRATFSHKMTGRDVSTIVCHFMPKQCGAMTIVTSRCTANETSHTLTRCHAVRIIRVRLQNTS